jgi:hypothetical protein
MEKGSAKLRRRNPRQARAQGKHTGRPALDPELQRKIAKQLRAGLSAYAVAKQLGIDAHTVAKYSPFDATGGVARLSRRRDKSSERVGAARAFSCRNHPQLLLAWTLPGIAPWAARAALAVHILRPGLLLGRTFPPLCLSPTEYRLWPWPYGAWRIFSRHSMA